MEELKTIEELAKLSEEDYMTGLLNRRGGLKRIDEYIKENPDSKCAFIIFDGDNFKKINDTFGHQCCDSVIINSAQEIRRQFSNKGIIFRLGGDEFVVFIANIPNTDIAERKAKEILDTARNLTVEDRQADITASIGIAIAPIEGMEYSELFRSADRSLYCVKNSGRNGYCLDKEKVIH